MKSYIVGIQAVILLSACASAPEDGGRSVQTSAPPEVQEEINGLLEMFGRSRYQCGEVGDIDVESVEIEDGAEYNDQGKLAEGTVREVWEVEHCRQRARYEFRVGIHADGTASLEGFADHR